MDVIFVRIIANDYKYGKCILNDELVLKYDGINELEENNLTINICSQPCRRTSYKVNGIFLHYLLAELIYCNNYRRHFMKHHVLHPFNATEIKFNLEDTDNQIIDHKWNDHITYLVREKCELEHALSWLSTLGGAFSALGDYFFKSALVAGKISYHQLLLAVRMGDANIASRCKLYFSLSLIQRCKFKLARRIIETEYHDAKNAVIVDTRLVKMCLGIWAKLQYEYDVHREIKKCKRLQIK